jgi:hypothetical protein
VTVGPDEVAPTFVTPVREMTIPLYTGADGSSAHVPIPDELMDSEFVAA